VAPRHPNAVPVDRSLAKSFPSMIESTAYGLGLERGHESSQRFVWRDEPMLALSVTPRLVDVASFEAPFQPSQSTYVKCLKQLKRVQDA